MAGEGFRRLIVWQKAYELVLELYKITKHFPSNELYGLTSQIRRAAISVIGNIAEGYERQYRKEYLQFLMIAKGSLGEVEAYILLSKDLGYINEDMYFDLNIKRQEASKVLRGLIRSLKSCPMPLAP